MVVLGLKERSNETAVTELPFAGPESEAGGSEAKAGIQPSSASPEPEAAGSHVDRSHVPSACHNLKSEAAWTKAKSGIQPASTSPEPEATGSHIDRSHVLSVCHSLKSEAAGPKAKAGTQPTSTNPEAEATAARVDRSPAPGSEAAKPFPNETLERRLYNALRYTATCSPTSKEFHESYAFAVAVRNHYGIRGFDVVLDVCGGHGALAAMLLTMVPTCRLGVVIDPAECVVGERGVREAWHSFYTGKELRYRRVPLQEALAEEIEQCVSVQEIPVERILVVACHACQYLTDEVLTISETAGVNVCVMPCCQKDSTGGSFKNFAKSAGVDFGLALDLHTAGRMQRSYDVKMKLLTKACTPQNRLILCRRKNDRGEEVKKERKEKSVAKLKTAYHAAHSGESSQAKVGSTIGQGPRCPTGDLEDTIDQSVHPAK
eukprot:gene4281-14393_t